ncbi:type II toxin-antitoxin system VapC family toxin, partial [Candidatus Poribacteria bacterium]|nr:type II toxin-antitoxin system VapC family toxin [Candidatus Poribacteria bacterium]
WTLCRDWGIQRRSQLEVHLAQYSIYQSNRNLCERWAEVMEIGRKTGRPISCADAWIAATALELECPLITHNAKDFTMIPALEIRSANPG